MTKILITGGLGFIGFHLAKHCSEKGDDVTICDNQFRGKLDEEVHDFLNKTGSRFIKIDLSEKDQLKILEKDFDAVYHLAAINGTRNFYEMPETVLRVNILSTINILDWVIKTKCKDVLFSSSSETYSGTIQRFGWEVPTGEDVPLCIEDVTNPRYSYGGSKIVGELLFLNYGRKYSLNARIARFHNIYGERMGLGHVIPEFCKRILEKEDPFLIYGGKETRAFIYVKDGVKAARLIMGNKKTKGEIINVGNQEEIKILDLAKLMFKIAKVNPKVEIKDAPKGSVARRCPKIKKLADLTGHNPNTPLKEGLEKTFAWYREEFDKNKGFENE